jgi:hypothetical protein
MSPIVPWLEISISESGKEISMSKVDEIKAAIEALPEGDYAQLRQWFSEKDWQKWDRQIEIDSDSGKLDFLIKEALNEKGL